MVYDSRKLDILLKRDLNLVSTEIMIKMRENKKKARITKSASLIMMKLESV